MGVPSEMPFEDLGAGTKGLEDMEEHSYHGPEGCKVSLAGWAGTPETSVEEHSVSLDIEAVSYTHLTLPTTPYV